MQTYLEEAILNVQRKIQNLGLSRSTEIYSNFEDLKLEQEKDIFIKKSEQFWQIFNNIHYIILNLDFIQKSLKEVKIKYEEIIKTKGHSGMANHLDLFQPIIPLTNFLVNTITELVKFCEGLSIVTESEFDSKFNELQFIRFLRNDFVQHPSPEHALDSLRGSIISNFSQVLPLSQLGPSGGGWGLYIPYYENKTATEFKQLTIEQRWEKNKIDFINVGGWKKAHGDPELIARLKYSGLPLVNQEELGKQLHDLFESKIFPYLNKIISQAKADNIL